MAQNSHPSIRVVKMDKFANIDWGRVLLGAVAIAVSIFLAFEIGAWRQDRQVGSEEQEVVQSLGKEFTSLNKILTRHLAEHSQTLESLEHLLIAIENGPSIDAGSIIESAFIEMTSPVTWDRNEGALDALLSSERTKNLTNTMLRAKLSAWQRAFGEFLGDQEIANKMIYETHIPYFTSKNIAVSAIATEANNDQPGPERSISIDSDAIGQLLEDPKFHVLVEVRYRFKEHLIVEIETAIAAAKAILSEIETPSS
jgi:hypothetical protein